MNIHNQYDKDSLIEINQWKYKKPNLFNDTLKLLHSPVNYTSDMILKAPIVGEVLQEVINGLLSMNGLLSICDKGAQFSVRHNSIFREYREKDFSQIQEHAHIHHLNLQDVDTVVGWLGAKYKNLSTAEGAATGVKGFAGLAFDIPALIFINLRAIGEYATYYGYDISKQEERIFSLYILNLSVADDIEKENILRALSDLVKQIKAQPLWEPLNDNAFSEIIQDIAKSLSIKITKAKSTQTIPILGAAIGAGFNAYFTNKTCNAAYYLYRERFLIEQYGIQIIS